MITVLKTKQTTHKKKSKLESFKKIYIFINWISILTKQQQFNLS